MKYDNDDFVYAFSAVDMRVLQRICTRLYDATKLPDDARRDLANQLRVLMDRSTPIEVPK